MDSPGSSHLKTSSRVSREKPSLYNRWGLMEERNVGDTENGLGKAQGKREQCYGTLGNTLKWWVS